MKRFVSTLQRTVDRWLDPALAVSLCVAAELEVLTADYREGPLWANAVVIAFITLPLAWRRKRTLLSLSIMAGAALLMAATLTDLTTPASLVFLVIIPPYTAGAWLEQRRAIVGLAMYCALGIAVSAMLGGFDDLLFTVSFAVASWVVGRSVRSRRLLAVELQGKAARIEAERETRARLAVADERTRIARELHAVVAASVSEMVVESEAAERLLDHDLRAAENAMAHVEDRGREALREMRRILGVLRREDEGPELAPQPGIGQAHTLIERARQSGLDVVLRVEGDPSPVPVGIDLAAYRVMQDTLAELVTAAPGARALAFIDYRPEELELSIELEHQVAVDPNSAGLLRVQERVATYSGRAWAERTDSGGYRFVVRLPRAFEEVTA
jgi:signal transduction histidine kinase